MSGALKMVVNVVPIPGCIQDGFHDYLIENIKKEHISVIGLMIIARGTPAHFYFIFIQVPIWL